MMDFERIYSLTKWLEELLSKDAVSFEDISPSSLPAKGGIYLISDNSQRKEQIVYVGLTSNLKQRVYTGQLQGNKASSTIKPALVEHGRARDISAAKEYMKSHCTVRFDEVPDFREREMREGFAKAVLSPQFSLYKSKEH